MNDEMRNQVKTGITTPCYFGRDLEAMSFAINYHKWIIAEFQPYLRGTVAEVGAGTGNFSELMIQNAFIQSLLAVEPSANMFPHLKKCLSKYQHVKVLNNFFGEISNEYKNHFDSIVYVNVLEHIEDDQEELNHIHNALKQGNHLLLFVPALPWLYSEFDKKIGHFRRYRKNELITKVQSAGFRVVKVRYFDMVGILPWFLFFVLLNKTLVGSNVTLYDQWVVPIMHRFEGWITPPIGKNLLLIGEKE